MRPKNAIPLINLYLIRLFLFSKVIRDTFGLRFDIEAVEVFVSVSVSESAT